MCCACSEVTKIIIFSSRGPTLRYPALRAGLQVHACKRVAGMAALHEHLVEKFRQLSLTLVSFGVSVDT